MLTNSAYAMQFIIEKVIELSGSNRSRELQQMFRGSGQAPGNDSRQVLEEEIGNSSAMLVNGLEATAAAMSTLQEQIRTLGETQQVILERLGGASNPSAPNPGSLQ